jgi:hypothetical protein
MRGLMILTLLLSACASPETIRAYHEQARLCDGGDWMACQRAPLLRAQMMREAEINQQGIGLAIVGAAVGLSAGQYYQRQPMPVYVAPTQVMCFPAGPGVVCTAQ